MAAVTRLSIYNSARVKAGEETVADTTLIDFSARVLDAIYGDIVQQEIENGAWFFATKRVSLDLFDTNTHRALPFEYQIPSDALVIDGLHYLDNPISGQDFLIEDGSIWTAFDEHIVLLYRYRADESVWPRRFANIVIDELTAALLDSTERHSEAQVFRGNAQRKRVEAKHSEAQQRPTRAMGEGSIIDRRRGGAGQQGFTPLGIIVSGGGGGDGGDGGSDSDDDLIEGVGTSAVTVPPGTGYVAVDCSTADRTITFDAGDTSLRKEVVIQKSSAGGVLTVNDGTTDVYAESTTQRVTYRRLSTGTVMEISRST